MYAENLMRYTVFSEDTLEDIKTFVIKEMEKIDSGFGFGQNVIKKKNQKG